MNSITTIRMDPMLDRKCWAERGGRKGGREEGREGGREGGRKGGREEGREGGREGGRKGGRKGGERGRKRGKEFKKSLMQASGIYADLVIHTFVFVQLSKASLGRRSVTNLLSVIPSSFTILG